MTSTPARSAAATNQATLRDRIKTYILDRGLSSGDLLPTEQQLMTELGVGRHPLREAMKALQATGIVDVRHGYGTYVGTGGVGSLEDGLAFRLALSVNGDVSEVEHLLQVRQALEVGLAHEVVASRDDDQLDRLTQLVEQMERAATGGDPIGAHDLAFHRELYRLLGNTMIDELLGVFWRSLVRVDRRLPHDAPDFVDSARWHRDILDELRGGDPNRYAAAMRRHFVGIHARFG